MNISTETINQTFCVINKNENSEVKTNNIEKKETETIQEADLATQSSQILKKDI
ncbi:23652_t:CDS:1, partial [Gigaspora margarita]